MGITLNLGWSLPATQSPEDLEAQDRNRQFSFGWFAHPIFRNGDYPDIMKTKIAEKSRALNLTSSRLPEFTQAEKDANRGKSATEAVRFSRWDCLWLCGRAGECGIVLNWHWAIPADANNPDDQAAAERSRQFYIGWLANPIFGSGDYPAVMKELILNKSLTAGLTASRLPEFSPREIAENRGTSTPVHDTPCDVIVTPASCRVCVKNTGICRLVSTCLCSWSITADKGCEAVEITHTGLGSTS